MADPTHTLIKEARVRAIRFRAALCPREGDLLVALADALERAAAIEKAVQGLIKTWDETPERYIGAHIINLRAALAAARESDQA